MILFFLFFAIELFVRSFITNEMLWISQQFFQAQFFQSFLKTWKVWQNVSFSKKQVVNRALKFSGDQYGFLHLILIFFSRFVNKQKRHYLMCQKNLQQFSCLVIWGTRTSLHQIYASSFSRVTTKRAARQDLYLMMTKWCLCLRRTVGADVQVAAKLNKTLAHSHASRLQIDNWTKTESGSIGKTQINRHTIVHSNRHFLSGPNKEEMLRGYDNWRQRQKKKTAPADKLSRDGWALADYTDLYLFIKQSAAFKCQRLRIQSEL